MLQNIILFVVVFTLPALLIASISGKHAIKAVIVFLILSACFVSSYAKPCKDAANMYAYRQCVDGKAYDKKTIKPLMIAPSNPVQYDAPYSKLPYQIAFVLFACVFALLAFAFRIALASSIYRFVSYSFSDARKEKAKQAKQAAHAQKGAVRRAKIRATRKPSII
jgi:hypothetical protein